MTDEEQYFVYVDSSRDNSDVWKILNDNYSGGFDLGGHFFVIVNYDKVKDKDELEKLLLDSTADWMNQYIPIQNFYKYEPKGCSESFKRLSEQVSDPKSFGVLLKEYYNLLNDEELEDLFPDMAIDVFRKMSIVLNELSKANIKVFKNLSKQLLDIAGKSQFLVDKCIKEIKHVK